ncbi:sigma factor [Achromobacter insuavis]
MTAANLPTSILKTLYAEHHGWLRSWLRRKLGCPEQAADLAQDTFLRVLTSKMKRRAKFWAFELR